MLFPAFIVARNLLLYYFLREIIGDRNFRSAITFDQEL